MMLSDASPERAQGLLRRALVGNPIGPRTCLRNHGQTQGDAQMNRKGFTLIELLIVVVIIGILAAIAIPKFANTKGKAYLASMKSDLRNLVTAEEAYFADSVKYSTKVTSKVGGVACTPAAGDVSWCPTTGNNLTTLNVAGGGWDASMTNNNLTTPVITCSIFVNEAGPVGAAISEGAPACQ